MISAQIHLAFSHVAVIGCFSALAVLVTAHATKVETVFKLGYGFVLASAAAAAVSYFTGPPTYDALRKAFPFLEKSFVENHAVMGKASFVVLMIVGVVCLSTVTQYFQGERPSRGHRLAVLLGLVAACLILAWTAHLGGFIRHPEIR